MQVWYLRVDIHVLDADGNVTDAVVLSALAALLSFRRPDVSVGGADGRWGEVLPTWLRMQAPGKMVPHLLAQRKTDSTAGV